jgi:hypothetical protein
MTNAAERLVDLLDLEQIEVNIFRGRSPDESLQRVFGGQVAGQALVAAGRTTDGERPVHSLHAYFLRPGRPGVPIVYQVERVRDGVLPRRDHQAAEVELGLDPALAQMTGDPQAVDPEGLLAEQVAQPQSQPGSALVQVHDLADRPVAELRHGRGGRHRFVRTDGRGAVDGRPVLLSHGLSHGG